MIKFEDYYNVAICFSGQLRTCKHAAKNILSFFTPSHGCTAFDRSVRTDFFMHTWNKNTWRFPKKGHQEFNIQPIDTHDIDFMRDTYELRDFKVGDFEKYPNSHYAWDPLFYSFDQSMILKRDYELTHGFEYDLVIKIRPDIVYDISVQPKFLYNQAIETGTVYSTSTHLFPMEFYRPNIDDVIFFGDSPTMDLVSTLWRNTVVERNELGLRNPRDPNCTDPDILPFLGPGTLLHRHIINTGLSYDTPPPLTLGRRAINYMVLRRTATDLNLDSVNDINKIFQIGRDWYI